MLSTDDGESGDPLVFIEDVEALYGVTSREARDDADVPEAAYLNLAVPFHGAAADKVFVYLRKIEAANHRPNCGRRRVDSLRHEGGALAGTQLVLVVSLDGRLECDVLICR